MWKPGCRTWDKFVARSSRVKLGFAHLLRLELGILGHTRGFVTSRPTVCTMLPGVSAVTYQNVLGLLSSLLHTSFPTFLWFIILGNSTCISGVETEHIWRAVTIVVITLTSGGNGRKSRLSGLSKIARSKKEMLAAIVVAKHKGKGGGRTRRPSIPIASSNVRKTA